GPPALYVAKNQGTALVESTHGITSGLHGRGLIKPSAPIVIYAIKAQLDRVLDLTDESVVEALGTSAAELKGPWAQQMKNGDPVPTHILAEAAYASHRFQGIKYRSVEDPEGV